MKTSKWIKSLVITSGLVVSAGAIASISLLSNRDNANIRDSLVVNMSSNVTNNNNSGTNTNSGSSSTETEKPKTIDATELERNKVLLELKVPEAIAAIITRVNAVISDQIAAINSDTTMTLEEKFEKGFYISKVRNYLDNNIEKIKENPRDWGFWIVFPLIYTENLKINIGKAKWNGKESEGFSFGSTPATNYEAAEFDYSDLVVDRKENFKVIDNIVTNEKLKELWDSYRGELDKDAVKFILNSEDQPKLGKDYQIKVEYTEKGAVFTGSEPTIDGFKTWDQYIKDKIGKRILDFDITQNLQNNTAEPPVVLPDTSKSSDSEITIDDGELIDVTTDFEIRDVKKLSPYATVEYVGRDTNWFVSTFNAATDANKAKMFFFDNPVNTRFTYVIDKLEIDSTDNKKINAVVRVSDLLNEANGEPYTVSDAFSNLRDASNRLTWMRFLSYETLRNQMEAILKIFNVNGSFDFSKLNSIQQQNLKIIRDTIFALTKIVFTNKFQSEREELINTYAKLRATKSNINQYEIEVQTLLLSWMKNTKVIQNVANKADSIPLINYMSKVTTNRVNNIIKAYTTKANEIEKILPKFGLTSSDVALAFAKLNQEVKIVNKLSWNDNTLRDQFNAWFSTSDAIDKIVSPLEAIYEQLTTPNADTKVNQSIGNTIKAINDENAQTNQALIIAFSTTGGAITLIGLLAIASRFVFKRRS